MRTITEIEGQKVTELSDNSVTFNGFGRIDDDGEGSSHNDPCHQNETSLKVNGEYLNADVDWYVVSPPQIVSGVRGIVLGCQAFVSYNGITRPAVVGDVGPRGRIGEMSIALAKELGINPNPNTGGIDTPSVSYKFLPGTPAIANGKKYQLQAS